MLNPIVHQFKYGNHIITLETGLIARQATAAVVASMDDTSVLVTVVAQKKNKIHKGFFPLTVNYQERSYAAGKIPGSFFRREGRPTENEIIIARLIDRAIRPLFPQGFINEIQITVTVVSLNPQINPDIIAMIGTSVALSISGIPFNGPISAARIGYVNNEYILNPTTDILKKSSLDLVVAGTNNAVLMVECTANIISEEKILESIFFGYNQQQIIFKHINIFIDQLNISHWNWQPEYISNELIQRVIDLSEQRLSSSYQIKEKQLRYYKIDLIKSETITTILAEYNGVEENAISTLLHTIEKKIVRRRLVNKQSRIDGREKDMIRNLDVRIGILQRTHGSALFTRGETQALVSVTLGTARDAQNMDDLMGDRIDNFLFHYNFPPYSVGEIGMISSPQRREVGHGRLAKKSLLAIMPKEEDFPYTIRIVSEITESNGSSSMASVCGASLALMDAGVPIRSAIAGIAMGLVKEQDKFIILSDILSDEDHLGDMDFKVAGTYHGITALQMDIKIEGITYDILQEALRQAKKARIHILQKMEHNIHGARQEISKFAPRIRVIQIHPDKIKDLIGKGGIVIRNISEETGANIEVNDGGGVKILADADLKINSAICRIEDIISDVEIGRVYQGEVTRITEFGAFVIIGNKEGLVHISQIANKRVEKISDYLRIGQKVMVKVLDVDRQSRIRLSIKATII